MCFSAPASFVASAALLSASAYILYSSKPIGIPTLVSATIPLIFSLQQTIEGIVWTALNHGNPELANTAGIVYIFFAYLFWPAYIPFFGMINEPIGIRRNMLCAFSIAGLLFGVFLYVPIIMHYVSLNPTIMQHSLSFIHKNYYSTIPFTIDFAVYMIICPLSLLISSHKCIRDFSLVILFAFGISYIFFYYALSSVWCFFAAIVSLNVTFIEEQLKPSRAKQNLFR